MRRAGGGGRDEASAAALRLLLAAGSATAPSPLQQQLLPQPDPKASQSRPAPKPTSHFPTAAGAYSQPGKKLPRWLGVNRHLEQRTKGKESHKAGRLGSRGLVSLTPHPLAKCVCCWNAGGEAGSLRTCWPRRTAAQAAPARRGRPEVASLSRTQPSPLQGRQLHTHAHTHARPHAPRPRRENWSCPPLRMAPPPPSQLQRPRRGARAEPAARTPGGAAAAAAGPGAALLMAAAAARNLRDPRAAVAAAAAPGIPPSLDNPKHKHSLLPLLLPAPGLRPPPRRRRRPSSGHTRGRRLALTPPSAEILNRGAGRGVGGKRGARGRGPQAPGGGGGRARRRPGPRHDRRRREGGGGGPGGEAGERPPGPWGPGRGGRARALPLPGAE